MSELVRNAGSYRDPDAFIYEDNERIFRVINESGREHYKHIKCSSIVNELISRKLLIPTWEIPKTEWPQEVRSAAYVLGHEKIPYVSYPYEWSFNRLKAAALHHLELQIILFDSQIVLKDSSSYNIQFVGKLPIFIDYVSLAPYKKGEFWLGHTQFCEQFLNPLLLRSKLGVAYNSWYRGSLEGIKTTEINRLLPLKSKLSWNMFTQVLLKSRLEGRAQANQVKAIKKAGDIKHLSPLAYKALLLQMKNWISKLVLKREKTLWSNYNIECTYSTTELQQKKQFITDFVKSAKPKVLVDLGCNTGLYSNLALDNGAGYVIGFDFDETAVDTAFLDKKKHQERFCPLYLDASNPSPSQGWMQGERIGFSERTHADALISLAFIHHLVIAKNVPIESVVDWLLKIASCGVIEFVPKEDETIKHMLALRQDIFFDYTEKNFLDLLKKKAKIIKTLKVSPRGRMLCWYTTNDL